MDSSNDPRAEVLDQTFCYCLGHFISFGSRRGTSIGHEFKDSRVKWSRKLGGTARDGKFRQGRGREGVGVSYLYV